MKTNLVISWHPRVLPLFIRANQPHGKWLESKCVSRTVDERNLEAEGWTHTGSGARPA